MDGGCTIWLVMYGSGEIAGITLVVRPVCIVAGATTPGSVIYLLTTSATPTPGTTSLASAWSLSRSQLAAHSGFAFGREGACLPVRLADACSLALALIPKRAARKPDAPMCMQACKKQHVRSTAPAANGLTKAF